MEIDKIEYEMLTGMLFIIAIYNVHREDKKLKKTK
jgi:hypothetical protein